jgi:hypothetical protein
MKGGDNMTQQTRITLQFNLGTDVFGDEIYREKRFNNIKGLATDEAIEGVALALGTLQQHTLQAVVRNNSYRLV